MIDGRRIREGQGIGKMTKCLLISRNVVVNDIYCMLLRNKNPGA